MTSVKTQKTWRAEFGALLHKDASGFVFTVAPARFGVDVAKSMNEAEALPDLLAAAKLALEEMRHTIAPRSAFTDAVDALDAAIAKAEAA